MLIPKENELNKDFVKRCMNSETMQQNKNKLQRLAICCSRLKYKKKSKKKQ